MKKSFYLLCMSFLLLMACDESETSVFDPINGQTGVSFTSEELLNLSVPEEGLVVDLAIEVTTVVNQERTFDVVVLDPGEPTDPDEDDATTANPEDYSIGTLTIPAGEHIGNLAVSINYDTLEDFVTETLTLQIQRPEGVVNTRFDTITISFLREFICPDLVLNITFDSYPQETSWVITNSGGDTVASGGDYGGESTLMEDLCLIDGDYTFTISDTFSDGICCGYGNGSYNMTLDGVELFSGGEFGASESQNFTVN